ncbi:MAG TPA: bifunctional diaminohydroxyphosphoribosylaminopyrimidine deaminase/5-amino-6-(5-phosphoribosylamino)uracil reductase RibD [Gammaproteobacteria bacterium]|jgi:diaminohydroxyphosphoribosylaminopyrimidine deaminase/5-amino-6-(5-phosphoribosylamino)uracil reductase|nr:bifunctional diaminohydroxyphosphoribosylaminopyrimidine deaminase/5-amino-6-(5-phosphoribosylamino)uracil reductase RibD [Arenicellales bacterium]MDP6551559.1 bifunctional diaminohydroxyphosphoribosylaminopyrimidine deaminase/5-amino-6-(5-phosphoribosylamino)uracil reductase RibD [Arenicellales bacterium]MDP6790927.1 bifunctional diaminohydroxyphosphoribosylaminopyrimidine deaminase/5-amino-6-(5-phosphoribosylamino)uracil reductase RibD [Arenicellales bacterium]MDP6918474.1 bifunctional diam|tara:strand:- start:20845 stop:21951 length:1107 start_codon:yes stop_codon:yes gene_type:complete
MSVQKIEDRERRFLERAVELAENGLYTTKPNPRVGCVVALGEEIVGEGWHQRAGEAHAEIHALSAAGSRAKGAEVFVSLEPCAHTGRTGPCAQALIDAGVKRVVTAMVDPNPQVAGKGLEMLSAAGIDAEVSEDDHGARGLNAGFCRRMAGGRPLVRLKVAATLDGRTAANDGSSQWITGEAARADVHRLRASSCAIVTGIGTVKEDNPRLNARVDADVAQPLRVVLDGKGQLDPQARLFSEPGDILIVTSREDDEGFGFDARTEQLCLAGDDGRVDVAGVLDVLAERACNEVLVEAGAGVAGAFVSRGLVDELWVYQSPDILGSGGQGMFVMRGMRSIDDRVEFELKDICRIRRDIRLIYVPTKEGS